MRISTCNAHFSGAPSATREREIIPDDLMESLKICKWAKFWKTRRTVLSNRNHNSPHRSWFQLQRKSLLHITSSWNSRKTFNFFRQTDRKQNIHEKNPRNSQTALHLSLISVKWEHSETSLPTIEQLFSYPKPTRTLTAFLWKPTPRQRDSQVKLPQPSKT